MWNREEENESSLKDDRIDKSFLIVIKHDYVIKIENYPKYSPIFQIVTRCKNKYKKLVIHEEHCKNLASISTIE